MRVALIVLLVLVSPVAGPADALVACTDASGGAPRFYVNEGSSCTEGRPITRAPVLLS